jgi:hypothetical protein
MSEATRIKSAEVMDRYFRHELSDSQAYHLLYVLGVKQSLIDVFLACHTGK